jgi:hypothetical protein
VSSADSKGFKEKRLNSIVEGIKEKIKRNPALILIV